MIYYVQIITLYPVHFLYTPRWRHSAEENCLCCLYSSRRVGCGKAREKIHLCRFLGSGCEEFVVLPWPLLKRNIWKVVRLPHHVKRLERPSAWRLKCIGDEHIWEMLMLMNVNQVRMASYFLLPNTKYHQTKRNRKHLRSLKRIQCV